MPDQTIATFYFLAPLALPWAAFAIAETAKAVSAIAKPRP